MGGDDGRYIQGSRKAATVVIAVASLSQLWLPAQYGLVAPAALVLSATGLAAWVVWQWWHCPPVVAARMTSIASVMLCSVNGGDERLTHPPHECSRDRMMHFALRCV